MMYTISNQWILVGITSYDIGCAQASYAGIYTRVAYYQDWIRVTTSGAYTNATSSTSAGIDPVTTTPSTANIGRVPFHNLLFILLPLTLVKIYLPQCEFHIY